MSKQTILTVLMVLAVTVPASIALGGTYSDAVLAHGPIDYWRLDDAAGGAVNAGSSTQQGTYGAAVDRTAAGPRPTDTVGGELMLGFESGNTAAGFPGAGDSLINMGNYSPVQGTSARTYLAWLKPGAGATYPDYWFRYGGGAPEETVRSIINAGSMDVDYEARYVRTAAPAVDTWTFIAITLPALGSADDTLVYFNGQPATITLTADGSVDTGTGYDFHLGAWDPGWDQGDYLGAIDEFATFNKQLSAGQIADLFTAATTVIPEPSTVVMLVTGLLGLLLFARRRRRRRGNAE